MLLRYVIRKVLENNLETSLSGLIYANEVKLIDAIRTIERNADVLLNACKDIGLAVNIGNAKFMDLGPRTLSNFVHLFHN